MEEIRDKGIRRKNPSNVFIWNKLAMLIVTVKATKEEEQDEDRCV